MRDGIFKSLDMGRRWKSLMGCCEREADRGVRAEEHAAKALSGDVKRELSPTFLSLLRNHAMQNQTLIPGFGLELPPWGDPSDCSALERSIRAEVTRFAESGLSGREAVHSGVQSAVTDWNARLLRQVEQRVALGDRRAARPALAEAKRCLQAVEAGVVAEIIGASSPRRTAATRKPRLDLDEDLTARR